MTRKQSGTGSHVSIQPKYYLKPSFIIRYFQTHDSF